MPRPGAQFGQAQIEPRDLELLRVIGDQIGFPSVAALIVEIIEIMHGDQSERVPVRSLLKLGRQQRVLAERKNVRAVGAGVGVGLISEAKLPVDRQLVDRDRLIDRGDIGLHFGVNVGGHIRGVEHGVEIIARHLVGAQMKIEHAELELHPGKIRVVVEHAFERADRRLVVAEFRLELGVTESGVEIVGFEQQALEQEVGGDELVRMAQGRGRRGGGLGRGRGWGAAARELACAGVGALAAPERAAGEASWLGVGATGACAKAAGGEPNAAPATPIAAANMAPNRDTRRAAPADQSSVGSPAQPTGAHTRLDRLELFFCPHCIRQTPAPNLYFLKVPFRPNATEFSTTLQRRLSSCGGI